ncbi:MAG: GNAT family N-acetyltransferase [Mediterranea sp.]|jgi:GNAT superfamily N-acetyltransferase|nr:GNAT family N-acetyltransferase [Mediterranea sp.]
MIHTAIEELLKRCFPGSDEYFARYMRLRYEKDRSITVTDNDSGKLLGVTQLIAYPMTCFGSVVDTSYIYSACVHPEYRNQGIMRRILASALQENREKGDVLSTLIPAEPWLYDYYQRVGHYVPLFRYAVDNHYFTGNESLDTRYTLHVATAVETSFGDYLMQRMRLRPCCVQHTDEELTFILDDLRSEGCLFFSLRLGNDFTALAVGCKEEDSTDTLRLIELLADTPETAHQLLTAISRHTTVRRMRIHTPATADKPSFRMGSARIVNPLPLLRIYAAKYPEVRRDLLLTDPILPQNNGYYRLADNTCEYGNIPPSDSYETLTIGELTELLFAEELPYMSLMIN